MNVRPQTSVTFEPLKAESDITSGTHRTVWTAPVLKNSGSEIMFAKLTALKKIYILLFVQKSNEI